MGVHASVEVYAKVKELLEIPEDEPIFILRAQDQSSPAIIQIYKMNRPAHIQERVQIQLNAFRAWQAKFPGKIKEPD